MRTAIVIPARYASKRLPGKPLLRSTGKYLIEHVYERACQARSASMVIVGDQMYVTDTALPLTPAIGDEPEEDVTRWTLSRMKVPNR